MNYRILLYLFIPLLLLIPTFSSAGDFFLIGDGEFSIAETDTTNYQLFSFYDLRDRESFVQVTNTGGAATLHVQVFDVSNLCNENNFNDTYTPNDTHMYNLRDIQTNNGNDSGVVLPGGAYGFVVITVVQGIGQPTDTNGVIIGNFRVLDNAGYEYRANSQGFKDGTPIGGKYFINYTTAGDINRSDIVGITVNNLLSGEVTAAGSSVTFDTSIFNNNEVIFSCSDTTFSCTEATFEYGINNAIPHSRDKAVVCGSNNVPEGMVRLETINDTATEAFAGFAGINTGSNSRGSMDSLVAVRTIICGDGIIDSGEGETCESPGDTEPNGNECRFDCTFCGDGVLDEGQGETCDPPGNPEPPNDNECRDDCTFCGDGIVDMDNGEECDDGNDMEDDSCNNECLLIGGCCDGGEPFPMCEEDLLTRLDCTMVSTTAFYLGDGTMCDTTTNCREGVPPPGSSDCCEANGGIGCDDLSCEDTVCSADLFCCDVEWDGICAAQAETLCGELCSPVGGCCLDENTPMCIDGLMTEADCTIISTTAVYLGDDTVCDTNNNCPPPPSFDGDCCVANGTPGCEDELCEEIVCGSDPFCCNTAWDLLCATPALIICEVCAGDDGG